MGVELLEEDEDVLVAPRRVGERGELLHGGDDDADEEVEDGEGGQDDEGDEEEPGLGVLLHDGADDAHRPALERHDLEERVEALPERAEPLGVGAAEEGGGENARGVDEDAHDGHDAGEAGNGVQEGGHDLAQLGQHGEEAQHPEDAERAVDRQLHPQLDDEREEAEGVEQLEPGAEAAEEGGVGLEAEDDGVEQDERDDDGPDARGLDPAGPGDARFRDLAAALAPRPVEELVSGLLDGVAAFEAGAPPSDDKTLVVLRRAG